MDSSRTTPTLEEPQPNAPAGQVDSPIRAPEKIFQIKIPEAQVAPSFSPILPDVWKLFHNSPEMEPEPMDEGVQASALSDRRDSPCLQNPVRSHSPISANSVGHTLLQRRVQRAVDHQASRPGSPVDQPGPRPDLRLDLSSRSVPGLLCEMSPIRAVPLRETSPDHAEGWLQRLSHPGQPSPPPMAEDEVSPRDDTPVPANQEGWPKVREKWLQEARKRPRTLPDPPRILPPDQVPVHSSPKGKAEENADPERAPPPAVPRVPSPREDLEQSLPATLDLLGTILTEDRINVQTWTGPPSSQEQGQGDVCQISIPLTYFREFRNPPSSGSTLTPMRKKCKCSPMSSDRSTSDLFRTPSSGSSDKGLPYTSARGSNSPLPRLAPVLGQNRMPTRSGRGWMSHLDLRALLEPSEMAKLECYLQVWGKSPQDVTRLLIQSTFTLIKESAEIVENWYIQPATFDQAYLDGCLIPNTLTAVQDLLLLSTCSNGVSKSPTGTTGNDRLTVASSTSRCGTISPAASKPVAAANSILDTSL